jgi:hypothetical protein
MKVLSGISKIDGVTPVSLYLTGIGAPTSNRKTGPMIQSWILADGIEPHAAVKTGTDESICGLCPHRPTLAKAAGKKPCYVLTFQAPLAVYRAYSHLQAVGIEAARAAIARSARALRVGAYGDPAAFAGETWQALATAADGSTGYSHQWRTRPDLASVCMASVDSEAEAVEARARGWRTFRVSNSRETMPGEIYCPSERVTCADCGLCAGNSRPAKSILIEAH